jgi:hypothetical protein
MAGVACFHSVEVALVLGCLDPSTTVRAWGSDPGFNGTLWLVHLPSAFGKRLCRSPEDFAGSPHSCRLTFLPFVPQGKSMGSGAGALAWPGIAFLAPQFAMSRGGFMEQIELIIIGRVLGALAIGAMIGFERTFSR